MLGGTSDIIQFCEHGFFDSVMFRDERIQYPDKNPVLGIYLGPVIDVGTEMTVKIMKGNGEVVHLSTYRGMKEDKWTNQAHILLRKEFNNNIKDRFGPDVSPEMFPDINLEDTILYEMYEDDTTDMEGGLSGNTEDYEDPSMDTGLCRKVPTPELNVNYVNALVMLSRGNSYAREKFIRRKDMQMGMPSGRQMITQYLTHGNIVLSFMMGRSAN